jgi:hypothetical protein
LPEVRFSHRLITTVWGCVFVGELILRITLIYHASASTVLFLSPILIGTLTIVTMIWARIGLTRPQIPYKHYPMPLGFGAPLIGVLPRALSGEREHSDHHPR